jgi:serine/threonine protein kinase
MTLSGAGPSIPARIGRALASPVGVLITMPLIVVGAGLAIMLVGRDTTQTASESLARRQLLEQARQIEREVGFALDQAKPILESLRGIADQDQPIWAVGTHLYDLAVGRAGIAWVSISYPDGTFQAAKRFGDKYEVQESRVGDASASTVKRYEVRYGGLNLIGEEPSTYDPRNRDFYQAAVDRKQRVWTRPYTFYRTHETGITCVEPSYAGDRSLRAVLTVDFDINTLSDYVGKAPVDGARTLVFTDDGTILAFPAADGELAQLRHREGQTLTADDLGDPSITALIEAMREHGPITTFTYLHVPGPDGGYLASVQPIGGKRADAATPLPWYVATIVPEETLLGPSRALAARTVAVSVAALAVAVVVALILAWNLVRMQRSLDTARGRAAAAEDRARELGSWRLVEKLGAGGMGEVWRAEHRLLVRAAAIKLVKSDPKATPRDAAETRERFRREAQALAGLRSRHTIEIFDYGVTEDGAFYYVMELLDGIDLDDLATKFGPQPAARVIQLMQGACASLAEAHDAGLLHRDVKPANIVICRAADEVDVVKVLDFGIVHVAGTPIAPVVAAREPIEPTASGPRMTEYGVVLGTPGFMSPEQARGQPLDARADLYGLGCVAWMLLTGTEVFDRSSQQALLFQHVVEPVPALARRVPGWIPPGLVDVVTACLGKEPGQRPPSARLMMSMLRAIPIPEEHAWTVAKAQEWWSKHVPRVDRSATSPTGRLLVPEATGPGERPSTSTPEAATVRGAAVSGPPTGAPTIRG